MIDKWGNVLGVDAVQWPVIIGDYYSHGVFFVVVSQITMLVKVVRSGLHSVVISFILILRNYGTTVGVWMIEKLTRGVKRKKQKKK